MSNAKPYNDGGPAFPTRGVQEPGMSRLDVFASDAMNGLLRNPEHVSTFNRYAVEAVTAAESLLAELDRRRDAHNAKDVPA